MWGGRVSILIDPDLHLRVLLYICIRKSGKNPPGAVTPKDRSPVHPLQAFTTGRLVYPQWPCLSLTPPLASNVQLIVLGQPDIEIALGPSKLPAGKGKCG